MKQIHILKHKPGSHASRVFAGVYGQLNEHGWFAAASEFKEVSSVFRMIASGAPILEGDVQALEVPEEDEITVRAQLMYALGMRWDSLYDQTVKDYRDSFATAALRGEAAMTKEGVNKFLADQGMRLWAVPVKAKIDAAPIQEADIVIARMQGKSPSDCLKSHLAGFEPYDILIDDTTPPQVCAQSEELGEGREALAAQPAAENLPSWSTDADLDVSVNGVITVPARSAEEAVVAAGWRLGLVAQNLAMPGLTIKNIVEVRQRENDGDGEGYPALRG
jgi:hypothetical protein